MTTTAYIALGANLGDRAKNLRDALGQLDATSGVRVTRVSSFLENPAVGGPPDAPAFVNAVAAVETSLDPHVLLRRLLEIEEGMGRVRRQKNDARPIDLDIILYADRVICTAELTVPHPLMHLRDFVLAPLAEIAPRQLHPVLGRPVSILLAEHRRAVGLATDGMVGGNDDAVLDGDVWCEACGYALRGLPRRHACPECGLAYDDGFGENAGDPELESLAMKIGFPVDALLLVLDAVYDQSEGTDGRSGGDSTEFDAWEICRGVREGALGAYDGDAARACWLLSSCGIRGSEDVGRIVFALVAAGRLTNSDDDAPSDFNGLFTLDTLFAADNRPPAPPARARGE